MLQGLFEALILICGPCLQVFFPPPSTPENKVPRVQPYEDTEEYRKASQRVAHAAAGSRHSIAVTTDGFYYSWGSGREWLSLGSLTPLKCN